MSFIIKTELKKTIKKPTVFFTIILLLIYNNIGVLNWLTSGFNIKEKAQLDPMQIMRHTQQTVQWVFLGLLFISVLVFWNIKDSNLLDLVVCNSRYVYRLFLAKASMPLLLTVVLSINTATYDVWWLIIGENIYKDFLIQLLKCWLINVFLPGVIAIILGFLFVLSCKTFSRVILLLIVSVFTFGGYIGIALYAPSLNIPWIYKVVDFFAIYPTGLPYWTDSIYGYSAENYRFAIQVFWIVFGTLLIYLKIKPRKKAKSFVSISVQLMFSSALFLYIALPNGAVRKEQAYGFLSESFYSSYYSYPEMDQLIAYSNYTSGYSETEAMYNVLSYDMEICITHEMNATVKVSVQNTGTNMIFTLYHGYRVKSITDQNGNTLLFNQSKDALEVFGTLDVTELTIKYKGFCYGFYSNDQAMFLPGDFAWYPVPGYKRTLKANDLSWYANVGIDYEVLFKIKVNAPYTVYSSLGTKDHQTFTGVTSRPVLLGGLVTENEEQGLRTLSSPLAKKDIVCEAKQLYAALKMLCKQYGVDLPPDFSYTYIQEPELLTNDTYYSEDHAVVVTGTNPIVIATGIAAWTIGDENEPATLLLREYIDKEWCFVSLYRREEPKNDLEVLYRDWASFAYEHGIDFTMDKTIEYVLQHKKSGIMNYLTEQLEIANEVN